MRFFLYFICFLSVICTDQKVYSENSLLVFGDSLSDTGAGKKLCETLSLPSLPPSSLYYNGRYCNGPIWIDYLTENLGLSCSNFAVGGAQSGEGQTLQPFGYNLGGLFQQIDRFEWHYQTILPDTTVIITIGSNDLLSLLFTPNQLTQEGILLRSQQTLANINQACQRLQALGATNIILWNIPDLGRTPKFNRGALKNVAHLISFAVIQFNNALKDYVQQWNDCKNETLLVYYDVYKALTEISKDLEDEGFDLSLHSITCAFHTHPPTIEVLQTGNQPFFFYDQSHPTTIVWERLAKKFETEIIKIYNYPKCRNVP